jgi:AraC-like DNA-binding protein
MLLHSKLLSLLHLILLDAEIPTGRSGKNYVVISKAKRYIEANFEKQIKLKDIASNVHLSEIYFHNIFTESTGISPHQYLIDCRIENAKKLLWNTDISICEIADKCGFGCQQYLNKVFKKNTGMTPAFYRKVCQSNYSL